MVVLILGISGSVYYYYFYNKSGSSIKLPENKTANNSNDCSKDEDVNGCESLKVLNKLRAEKGLSEITKDENLCNLAKNISEIISMQNKFSSENEINIFLRNLINDKKYDYITNSDNYSAEVKIFKEENITSDIWGAKYNYGAIRYDRGCIRYSEVKNKQFNRVVLLLESKSSK